MMSEQTNEETAKQGQDKGRSLREFDEELNSLRKENFNLKLRIFFLEERPLCTSTNVCPNNGSKSNDDPFSKQYIDLKVENEELRKELQEKQDLLCQAAKAIEVLENTLKKQQELNNSTMTELADEMKYIEGYSIQTEISKLPSQNTLGNNDEIQKCIWTSNFNENVTNLQSKIDTLESIIMSKEMEIKRILLENEIYDKTVKDYEETIGQLEAQINQFNRTEVVDMTDKQDKNVCIHEDQLSIIQDLEEKLNAKTRAHEKGCKTIQLLLMKTRDLDAEIEGLKYELKSDSKEMMMHQLPKIETAQEHFWCQNYTKVCSILNSRLTELALFLNSLLKHKVILNSLAHEEQKSIRRVIEDSLNLSQNLTIPTDDYLLTTTNALEDTCSKIEFLRKSQNEDSIDQKDSFVISDQISNDTRCFIDMSGLLKLDKFGPYDTEQVKLDNNCYVRSNQFNNSNREYESKRRIIMQIIQNESTCLNVLRETMLEKFSNDLNTLRNKITIQDSNSREDNHLQKQILEKSLFETKNVMQTLRQNENQLQIQIFEKEKTLQQLKRNLDDATLQISKAVLERTKFMKERDSFEKIGREYKEKYDHLLSESSELHTKLAKLEHESAQFHNQMELKETNLQSTQYGSVSVNSGPISEEGEHLKKIDHSHEGEKDLHDCKMIEKENVELKHKLERTRRAFEKTWTQLRFSNQRKEQIEKDIRQEIYKTHTVLKSARSNLNQAQDLLL